MTTWVPFAFVARPHGVRGEVRVHSYGDIEDIPPQTLRAIESVCLFPRDAAFEDGRVFQVQKIRNTQGAWLLTLEGVNSREDAVALKGMQVAVDGALLPELEDDEYYLYELEGASVVAGDGTLIGMVRGFIDNGAQIVMRIGAEGGAGGPERLVPITEETVVRFERASRRVHMDIPDGL